MNIARSKGMEFTYRILDINEAERWITIESNQDADLEEPESFIALINRIKNHVNGQVVKNDELQYKILGDGLGLIYQWDSCFGITVIYPSDCKIEEVITFLKEYF